MTTHIRVKPISRGRERVSVIITMTNYDRLRAYRARKALYDVGCRFNKVPLVGWTFTRRRTH